MKASELRINNYLYNDGVVVKIDARTIFDIWDDKGLKNYQPIPLTEEWLLRFGFEKKGMNRTRWTFWKIDLVEDEKGIYSFDESRIYIDIKYVHQLQNLYFALTNEEITYEQQK